MGAENIWWLDIISSVILQVFLKHACINWQVGVLLEHTVGNLDPLYIVNMVPNGLEIPRLV